ncbi:MAG: 50S ribosomal protein L3 [Myxococcota bacterium]
MGLMGKKLGMTQIFEDGRRIPVTVLELGPNVVVQKKTADGKDGYSAVQLGFGEIEHRKLTKAEAGHFKTADDLAQKDGKGVKPRRYLSELRVSDDKIGEFSVGQELKADVFAVGDIVDVTGTSRGKGFQGVMKRHHMKGSKNATHGTHEYFRHGGSVGMRTTPGRINRGKRMCGHMGDEQVTVQNLKIVKIDLEKNVVLIEGAVPGGDNSLIIVRQSIKKLGKAMQKKKTAA